MTGRDRNSGITDLAIRTMGYGMSEASEGPDIRLRAWVAELAGSFESTVVEYFDFLEIIGFKFERTEEIFSGKYIYDIEIVYNNSMYSHLQLVVVFRQDPRFEKWVILGLRTDEEPGPSSVRWIEFGGVYHLDLIDCLVSRGVKMPQLVRVRFDLLALFSENRYYTLLKEAIGRKVRQLGDILKSEIAFLKQIQNEVRPR